MSFSRSGSSASQSGSSHSNSTSGRVSPAGAQIDDVDSSSSVEQTPPPIKVWSTIMKIVDAIYTIDDKKGSSALAIQKYIATTNTANVPPSLLKGQIRTALKKGLDEGILIRPKGTKPAGVNGRYCLGFAKSTQEGKGGRCDKDGQDSGSERAGKRGCGCPKGRKKGKKRGRSRSTKRSKGRTKSKRRGSKCNSRSGNRRSKSRKRRRSSSKSSSKSRCNSRRGSKSKRRWLGFRKSRNASSSKDDK
ncbi:sperm-specific protein PHI-2B-like [Gigantopelta aegis]|uniref:sperm-specific protein PHI-2B-like n=1 Tax=Gigantopelta aegis TaxID=1735272 RepID=UPI001B88DD6D|nr:sperm-specific protein PHI-2B-like [Gigantopelta aegis]